MLSRGSSLCSATVRTIMPRMGSLFSSCRFINRHHSLYPPLRPTPHLACQGVKKLLNRKQRWGKSKAAGLESVRRKRPPALRRGADPCSCPQRSLTNQSNQPFKSRLRQLPDAAQGDCTFPRTPPLFLWLLISLM